MALLQSKMLSKYGIESETIFCLMEASAQSKSIQATGSYALPIDLHNLCNHFKGRLHDDCDAYFEEPLLVRSAGECLASDSHINASKWTEFLDYVVDYKKVYESEDEVGLRYGIFHDNLEWAMEHNKDKTHTYTVGANKFADMSHSEYKEYVKSGGFVSNLGLRGLSLPKDYCGNMKSETGTYPISMDWRSKGAVTPVRDQGQQGTCYAHAASENVESVYFIKKGTLPSLSVAQIVDCSYDYGDHGNNGGMYTYAWSYVMDHGLTTEAAYPYTAAASSRDSCKPFTPYTFLTGCNHVPANELQLTYAVSHQPVSVAIEADTRSFQLYSGGVYNDPGCGTTLDHAVVAVGYGNMNGQDMWIVRNSWGTGWGADGYIYMARNSVATSTQGICGIAMETAYPIL